VLPLEDRGVTLIQFLVYVEKRKQKIFTGHIEGFLLKEIRGNSQYPSQTVITLSGDSGLSIAEAYAQAVDKSMRQSAQVWHDFAKWFSRG
jgi:hypothetical protein